MGGPLGGETLEEAVGPGHHVVGEHGLAHDSDTGPHLSERDCEILEFERQWWKYAGAKETAVREKFDMNGRSASTLEPAVRV